MASVFVVGTFDTKGRELTYVRDLVAAAGSPVTTVDLGTGPDRDPRGPGGPNVLVEEVAAHHPDGPASALRGDRGAAVTAMAVAFERFVVERRDDIAGMLGLGGSGGTGGTALLSPAMRALPVGVPKVTVYTVAPGDVAPYVGPSDVAMIHWVTDVAGLNRISRRVLGNAAHAVAAMVANTVPLATRTSRTWGSPCSA